MFHHRTICAIAARWGLDQPLGAFSVTGFGRSSVVTWGIPCCSIMPVASVIRERALLRRHSRCWQAPAIVCVLGVTLVSGRTFSPPLPDTYILPYQLLIVIVAHFLIAMLLLECCLPSVIWYYLFVAPRPRKIMQVNSSLSERYLCCRYVR